MANNNQTRFEFSANTEDLQLATERLKELKQLQIQLAAEAQRGEKTIKEAIEAQSTARKEQLGIERLLSETRKATAEEQKRLAREAQQAQELLNASQTRTLGLLEAERAKLKELKRDREQAQTREEVDKYKAAIKASQDEINKLTGATDKFKGSNGFWRETRQLIVAAFAVDQIIGFGKELFNTQVLLDAQRVALKNVVDSQKDYEQSLSFLTNLGDKYGQSITGLTKTYTNFIASSKSSGLELKERQKIYESIIKAGSALTLSNEQIEGSLLAVSQMFSKGKVSAEELRGQLGERLPGAFGLFAKSLNVTEQELDNMLKKGEVLASETLPKFAKVLEETYGAKAAANVDTFGGAWNRLTNKITLAVDKFSTTNQVTQILAKGINFLADNLDKVFAVVGAGLITLTKYFVVTKAGTALTAIATTVENLYAVAKARLTGQTIALTAAQTELNIAMSSNPVGAVIAVIGAMTAAYFALREEQSELTKKTVEALAPLEEEKLRFNSLADAVLSTNIPMEAQYQKLLQLKQEHPELLKNVTDLSTAEKILKKNKIDTNVAYDYRLQKLAELKAQFPEQLKGITDLETAEKKLGNAKRLYNNDFLIRAQLLENEVKLEMNAALIKGQIAEKLSLQKEILARKAEGGIFSEVNNVHDIKRLNELSKVIADNMKRNDTVIEQSTKKKAQLNFQYEQNELKHENNLNNISKGGTEKRAKEKIDSAKTLALIQQQANLESLENTRETEELKLLIEQDIAIQRINDSKASETKKQAEIFKIVEKGEQDLAKLKEKWRKEDEKAFEKVQEDAVKLTIKYNQFLEKLRNDKLERDLKAKQKYAEEGKKLDEKVAKDEYELMLDQVELADKVRLLNKIAQAKNAEEIIKIKKDEQDKILKGTVEFYKKLLFQENINLQKIKLKYGENSNEYKKQKEKQLEAERLFTKSLADLTEAQAKQVEESVAKQNRKRKEALDYIMTVTDNVFGLIEKSLDKSLASTTDLVKQAQIKNQKQALDIAKQGVSAAASFIAGDIPGGIMKSIGIVFNGLDLIINGSKRKTEAAILQARQVLRTYLDFIQSDIDEFIASLETVKVLYGDIAGKGATFMVQSNLDITLKTLEGLLKQVENGGFMAKETFQSVAELAKSAGLSIADLVNAEVKRGEKITENYNKAKDLEEANYQKIIANINSAYDLQVQKINAEYDLKSKKAAQAYNAETLGIMAAGTAQLEALITNETSLASVRAEFAAKRLAVEQAFPLAATAITEGMSQAEIDAINNSIDARDAALAKIQAAYNTELATIINSEGQKRKEYSATEKIQNDIQANLDAAALKFQREEIERIKERALEIEKADKTKKLNLEAAEVTHKEVLKKINDDYTKAIEESYKLLTALLKAQQKEIEDALTNTAQKGSEEYKLLEQQLYRVKAALDAITGKTVTIPIVTTPTVDPNAPAFPITIPPIVIPPINIPIGGFAKGTERLPNMNGIVGTDTQLIKADIDERIMPKKINNQLRSHFGKDISNEDLARIAMVKSQTQMPNFINYSLAPTGNVRELIGREMKVQINMQMDNISKSIEKSTRGIVGALQEMPETSFKHDAKGLHRVKKTRNTVISEKLGLYFGE